MAQVALLLTCPGVPDVYQGDELWDLSLVDPDNRRPVDFVARRSLLERIESNAPDGRHLPPTDGLSKLWLVHRLLNHRRQRPDAYRGGYEPCPVTGAEAEHVVTFSRGDLVVVVPRLLLALDRSGWTDTAVRLPDGTWSSVLHDLGPTHEGTTAAADLLRHLPVAVLERAAR